MLKNDATVSASGTWYMLEPLGDLASYEKVIHVLPVMEPTCLKHGSSDVWSLSQSKLDMEIKSSDTSIRAMSLRIRKRKGIGTVITTLIILIASVVLGAGVIFFGGSLFQTNTENESIQVSNAHIWVAPNGTSSAAGFVVQNTGGKVVAIQGITTRGISVPQTSWYYNTANATADNVMKALKSDFSLNSVDVTGAAPEEAFIQATGPISLAQGQAVFIYVANPGGIKALDSGLAFNINVQAGKASASLASVSVTSG
jgi:hypothetical protein